MPAGRGRSRAACRSHVINACGTSHDRTGVMAAALVIGLILLSGELSAEQLNCTLCPGELQTVSEVGRRCVATAGARIAARCCVTETDTIIGLDLHNCSITHLDPTLYLPPSLAAIDLSQNSLQDLPPELFQGLTSLEYIALPPNIGCPGGDGAWRSVNHSAGVCQDQRDGCNSTGGVELLCPENSLCAPDGPGFSQCVCAPGFSGYKCLREGSFPIVMFFGILSSVTVTLCVLLWCTQRKKVKSQ
ncbi:all-trans retinoic acid-induced differentiation factor [Dendrobates tinctorius]|uniref:all-trans retinoic acid-induced differentiation factor n=1 Tax=Dendrobates tinctorius TaxID=92724 RepID=UPI003CC940A7